MNRNIVVDIDSTLWDFAWALEWELRHTGMPSRRLWRGWDFWKRHVSAEVFYGAVRKIHLNQNAIYYHPYIEAGDFLRALKASGFNVVIASHRDDDTVEPTLAWLHRHKLPFDSLHISHDKTVLFNNCLAIVDDSPKTLDAAERKGIVRTGLLHPWNAATGHPLFTDLNEVYEYLAREMPSCPAGDNP